MTGGEASKYESLGVIGRGGMATVFVGRARGAAGFRRLVALKRAHAHVRADATLAASMKHEAGLAARLHHPNVVRVIDVVEEAEDLLLVLDYVEGGSLAELLNEPGGAVFADARARARVTVRIMLDVAAGLDAAHRALDERGEGLGIVHRDVSPSNVLVGIDGIARLTDFGIAKALEGGSDLTDTGVLKGKIAYMAPEYVEHHVADAAADQFSLGVVLWESLAGRRLFRGSHDIDTLRRVAMCQVPSLADVDPVLAPLAPVLARALSRAPGDRFASVRELAEVLEAAARDAALVASHGEVGALVERTLCESLAARRRLVRDLPRGDSGEETARDAAASADARRPRDDIPTASVVSVSPSRRSASLASPTSAAPPASVAPPSSVAPPAGMAPPQSTAHEAGGTMASKRRVLVVLAVAIAMSLSGIAGIVAWRARVATRASEASAAAASIAAASEGSPTASASSIRDGTEPPEPNDSVDSVEPSGSSTAPRPRARPPRVRRGSGAGGRTVPSTGIVPRKAPPNPYVR